MDREFRINQFFFKRKTPPQTAKLPKFCLSGQTSNYLGNGFGPKLRAEDLVHLARFAPHFPNFTPGFNEHDNMAIAAQRKADTNSLHTRSLNPEGVLHDLE